ncbi:MAG: cell envelope integrity protein TolA [Thermoanaerobaculaceae bacterium]|nr:cell envelope integrity protein TolA [Thermoanaerobaculaceae bacterium]
MKRGVLVIALAAAPLLADDVYLRGGGQITGTIVERTTDSVRVDVGGGTLTVRMSSVVRIEETVSPLQEYRARAARIPQGDVEAWRELARWATSGALGTMASQAWSKVVEIMPDDPEANRALGRVQYGERWVTEEESYRARGYVEFEGEWMTPGERQAILEDQRARGEADRQAEAARLQAEEKAKREREAKEAAEHDIWRGSALPGDATYWPWGSGIVYWPATPVQPTGSGMPTSMSVGGPG